MTEKRIPKPKKYSHDEFVDLLPIRSNSVPQNKKVAESTKSVSNNKKEEDPEPVVIKKPAEKRIFGAPMACLKLERVNEFLRLLIQCHKLTVLELA